MYVAYEYVRGQNLREALRAGKVDDATAIEVAAQVLDALAHAHAKGIVHRDVKPANVMVEEAEEVSTRLLDFGLARLDELEGLTATGDVPGTLAYVAPERLEGQPAGGAADVWAVGVMLWEALAGWHPFAATSPVETARRIAAGAPRLATERPDLPREVCATVDSMLSVEPRRRPPARRLAADLRAGGELRVHRPHSAASRTALRERAAHALLAAVAAGGATTLLPFFPRGWPLVLAALAGLAALRSPVAGLAVALAAPLLPLGNLSLGLAIAYGVLASPGSPCMPGMRSGACFRSPPRFSLPSGPFRSSRWPSSKCEGEPGERWALPPAFRSQPQSPCWPVDRFRSPESPLARRLPSPARATRWT